MKKLKLILLYSLLCLPSEKLNAQQVTLNSIIDSSIYIFEGTVIKDSSFQGAGSIYTSSTIKISKIFNGKTSCGNAEIITQGGCIGEINCEYVTNSLSLPLNFKGVFMCVNTKRPSLPAPKENPHAMETYDEFWGVVGYQHISSNGQDDSATDWYWGGGALPGGMTGVYSIFEKATGHGYYDCQANDFSAPLNVNTSNPALTNSEQNSLIAVNTTKDNEPYIFPNPCTNSLMLVINGQLSIHGYISITDSQGREVLRKKCASISDFTSQMDVSSLSSGMYFVNVVSNTYQHTFKVQKQ